MGEPASRSNGRASWLCPFHQESNPSFCTLPPHENYKDRFKCFACGAWGDQHDLLKLYFLDESYPQRQDRLDQWMREFEAQTPVESPNSHRGRGEIQHHESRSYRALNDRELQGLVGDQEFSVEANTAIEALDQCFSELPGNESWVMLVVAQKSLEICNEAGLHPLSLAKRCEYVAWIRKHETEHMKDCVDLSCDMFCCRLARGWTEKEIKSDLARHRQEHLEASNK